MSGEKDLSTLLRSLDTKMHDGVYVFLTLPPNDIPTGLKPRMMFEEEEGTTLILLKSEAERANLNYYFPCRMITLSVHSSLEAVGFIARVSAALTSAGIGTNPVAGFYHDHLFIQEDRADDAVEVLKRLRDRQDY